MMLAPTQLCRTFLSRDDAAAGASLPDKDPSSTTLSEVSTSSARERPQSERLERYTWDPERSNQLESTITKLIELYRTAEVKDELRPSTLLLLQKEHGDEFIRLYHAAFKQKNRPTWATKRYPNGFSDFVSEIASRLQQESIPVINTARPTGLVAKLPQSDFIQLRTLSELYRDGSISKGGALRVLENDFEISLSPGQVKRYFPDSIQISNVNDRQHLQGLDERKRVLAAKVRALREDLELDFSLESCVRGLVFESFTGLVLQAIHHPHELQSQVRLPVAYKDLSGKNHHQVFLDFQIEAQTYEIKWKNDYRNIIESVLPQLIATEEKSGTAQKIHVICRHICPFTQLAYEANLRLDDDARQMGFDELQVSTRRLQDVMTYRSVESIISEHDNAAIYLPLLHALDKSLPSASTHEMRQWIEALDRTSLSDEERHPRLLVLQEAIETNREFSREELKRFFGTPKDKSREEQESFERRLVAIATSSVKACDELLLTLYNIAYDSSHTQLTHQMISELEQLDESTFTDAAYEYLAQREATQAERMAALSKSTATYKPIEIIQAFDSVEERRKADLISDINFEYEDVVAMMKSYDNINDAADAFSEISRENCHASADEIVQIASKIRKGKTKARTVQRENDAFLSKTSELHQDLEQLTDQFLSMFASTINDCFERGNNGEWDVCPDLSQMREHLDRMHACLQDAHRKLTKSWIYKLYRDIAKTNRRNPYVPERIRNFCKMYMQQARHPQLAHALSMLDICMSNLERMSKYSHGQVLSAGLGILEGVAASKTFLDKAIGAGMYSTIMTHGSFSEVLYAVANEGSLLSSAQKREHQEDRKRYVLDAFSYFEPASSINLLTQSPDANFTLHEPEYLDVRDYLEQAKVFWNPQNFDKALIEFNDNILRGRMQCQRGTVQVLGYLGLGGTFQKNMKLYSGDQDLPVLHNVQESDFDELSSDLKGWIARNVSDIYDGMVTLGVLSHALYLDFYSRKLRQSKILSYIDKEIAIDFLKLNNLDGPIHGQTYPAYSQYVTEISAENDDLFEGLLLDG